AIPAGCRGRSLAPARGRACPRQGNGGRAQECLAYAAPRRRGRHRAHRAALARESDLVRRPAAPEPESLLLAASLGTRRRVSLPLGLPGRAALGARTEPRGAEADVRGARGLLVRAARLAALSPRGARLRLALHALAREPAVRTRLEP